MTSRRKAVCTICSNNYLHFARTLMDSLRSAQPDWDRYLLLVDENRGVFDARKEPFSVIELSEIPIPDRKAFCFRYTIMELNTAVKPWLLEWLFEVKKYDQVVYLDPDIYAYEPLSEVEEALDAGNFLVLTPHLTGRLDDDAKPTEHDILIAGAYNLGFLALTRHRNLLPFLRWWQDKVEFNCIVDIENGLFVDQRWIDLVPGMFGNVAILRHEGYNLAYWNLKHRKVTKERGRFFVNSQPLVFFHFSGLDPAAPKSFSKHQDRFRLGNLDTAKQLVRTYCRAVIDNGLETCREWPYAFGSFTDGTPVLDPMRYYYRRHLEPDGEVPGDPFELGHDYFHKPWRNTDAGGPLVTILMRGLWESRKDIREHFGDIEGGSRWDFAHWFSEDPAQAALRPECCAEVVRRTLHEDGTSRRTAGPTQSRTAALRQLAKRFLPRRLKETVKRAVMPGTGLLSRTQRLIRRAAGLLPAALRHRLRALIRPPLAARAPEATAEATPPDNRGNNCAGFFAPERGADGGMAAWMGMTASIRILHPQPGTLKIFGEYHPEYHTEAGGAAETVIHARLDGESIGRLRLRKRGLFEKRLELPEPSSSRTVALSLEAGHCFVPTEIGMGNDRRRLSVKISRVELNDAAILDFARPPRLFTPGNGGENAELGINIVGYVRAEHGVGEAPRLCVAATEAASINYSLVDFNVGFSGRADDHRLSHMISNENPHAINLFHINADQMPLACSCLGRQFFDGRYNIGFWHWELPEFPDEWLPSFAHLDEIWTPSQFVMNAVGEKSPVPVVRMPHAVAFPAPSRLTRADMRLPADKFLFLMMYDMHSFQMRKNPEAVVEAFRKAFPNPENAALVIKTMNTDSSPGEWARIEKKLAGAPGIVVINRTLPRQEVYNLESLCDCFVSLHRSEGFGLGLAESMYLGKPVIGTNWSGNVDFMNKNNSCPVDYALVELKADHGPYRKGQRWAEPDCDQAAAYMKRLVSDSRFRRKIARAGQKTIRTEFSREAVGELYRRRLAVIARFL